MFQACLFGRARRDPTNETNIEEEKGKNTVNIYIYSFYKLIDFHKGLGYTCILYILTNFCFTSELIRRLRLLKKSTAQQRPFNISSKHLIHFD